MAAVARRLGVAPPTLRTWDRRYGLGPSAHTAGAHRRYSAADLSRLVVMRRLTLDGVAPSEAAQIAVSTRVPEDDDALAQVLPLVAASGGAARRDRGEAGHGAGGRVIAIPDAIPAARGLARAALALDTHEAIRIVREAIKEHGVVTAWERLAAPVLVSVGDRWQTTGRGVEVEHLLSESVLTALHSVVGGLRVPRCSRTVLLSCSETDEHSLPVHALAAALAERGYASRVLGHRVPREALSSVIRRSGPAVVLVYAQTPVGDPGQLAGLPQIRPAPRLLLGGPGWDDVALPIGARRVRTLPEALHSVLEAIAD